MIRKKIISENAIRHYAQCLLELLATVEISMKHKLQITPTLFSCIHNEVPRSEIFSKSSYSLGISI